MKHSKVLPQTPITTQTLTEPNYPCPHYFFPKKELIFVLFLAAISVFLLTLVAGTPLFPDLSTPTGCKSPPPIVKP
jgi:hypothetical protein